MNNLKLLVLLFCIGVALADYEENSAEGKSNESREADKSILQKAKEDSAEKKSHDSNTKTNEDAKLEKKSSTESKSSKEDQKSKTDDSNLEKSPSKDDQVKSESPKPAAAATADKERSAQSAQQQEAIVSAVNPFAFKSAARQSYIPQGYYAAAASPTTSYGAPFVYAQPASSGRQLYSSPYPTQYSGYSTYSSPVQAPQYYTQQYSYPQFYSAPSYPAPAPAPVYPALPTLYTPAVAPVVQPKPTPAAVTPSTTPAKPASESPAPVEETPASEKARFVWNCEIQPNTADYRSSNLNRYSYDQTRLNPAQYNAQMYSMPTNWGQRYGNYYTDVNQQRSAVGPVMRQPQPAAPAQVSSARSNVQITPEFRSKLNVKSAEPENNQQQRIAQQPQRSAIETSQQQSNQQGQINGAAARQSYAPEPQRTAQIWSMDSNGNFAPSPARVAQSPAFQPMGRPVSRYAEHQSELTQVKAAEMSQQQGQIYAPETQRTAQIWSLDSNGNFVPAPARSAQPSYSSNIRQNPSSSQSNFVQNPLAAQGWSRPTQGAYAGRSSSPYVQQPLDMSQVKAYYY